MRTVRDTGAAALGLAAALAFGQGAAGCDVSSACPLVDCADGANITLVGAATKVAASLPVTLDACVGTACSMFRLDKTGQAPVCTGLSAGDSLCSIDGEGTVVLSLLPLPDGTAAGATLTVHVTATSGAGTSLFDVTQMVTVGAVPGGGPGCDPGCETAEASFTP